MSKVLLISFTYLLSVASLLAQPVLTSAEWLPQVGETFGARAFDSEGISPGPSGANQTWDFSSIPGDGSAVVNAVDPSSTPDGSLFGNANLALIADTNTAYYRGSVTSFEMFGLISGDNTVEYTDPDVHMVFPFTFGNSNLDNFAGTADVVIPTFGNVTTHRFGTTLIEADGYGTLMLPGGTFTDVLRVKLFSEQTDSLRLLFFDTLVETTISSYLWYQAGIHTPLLSMTEVITELQPLPLYSGTFLDNTAGIGNLEGTILQFSVAPTVSNTSSWIRFKVRGSLRVKIEVINLLGKEIQTLSNSIRTAGEYSEKISLDNLSSGIYFVRGTFGNQVVTEKLIIP